MPNFPTHESLRERSKTQTSLVAWPVFRSCYLARYDTIVGVATADLYYIFVAAEFAIVEGGGSFIRVQSLQLYLLPPFVKISRYQNQSLKLSS